MDKKPLIPFRVHHIAVGKFEDGKEYYGPSIGFFAAVAKCFEIMWRNKSFRVWIWFG